MIYPNIDNEHMSKKILAIVSILSWVLKCDRKSGWTVMRMLFSNMHTTLNTDWTPPIEETFGQCNDDQHQREVQLTLRFKYDFQVDYGNKTILSPVISKQNASKKTQIINHIIIKFLCEWSMEL